MVFRADEETTRCFGTAVRYLTRGLEGKGVNQAKDFLEDFVLDYGSAVEAYPTWHPLVVANDESKNMHPTTRPHPENGYHGLDHTVHFVNAFITCPYDDGQKVLDSVAELQRNNAIASFASISAKRLNVSLYSNQVTPIAVSCEWHHHRLHVDNIIPKSLAIPLLLEKELPCWTWANLAETWEAMRPYFLGQPFGSRSSLFVDQETGQAMKTIWNSLIRTGMFGPIKVG